MMGKKENCMKTILESRLSHIDLFYVILGAVLITGACVAAFYSRMQFVLMPLPPIILISYLIAAFGFMLIVRGTYPHYSGKKFKYGIALLLIFCSVAPYISKQLGGKISDHRQFAKNDSLKSIQESYFIDDSRIAVVNRHSYQIWDFSKGEKLFSVPLTKIFGLRETYYDIQTNQVTLLNFKKELFTFSLKDGAKPEKISTKPKGFFLRNQKLKNRRYWPVKIGGLSDVHQKLIADWNPNLESEFKNLAHKHAAGYSLVYEEMTDDQSQYVGVFQNGTILLGKEGKLDVMPKFDCGENQKCVKGKSFATFKSDGEIVRCTGDQLSTIDLVSFKESNRNTLSFSCLGLEKSAKIGKLLVFGDSKLLIQDTKLGSSTFL